MTQKHVVFWFPNDFFLGSGPKSSAYEKVSIIFWKCTGWSVYMRAKAVPDRVKKKFRIHNTTSKRFRDPQTKSLFPYYFKDILLRVYARFSYFNLEWTKE